MAHEVKHPLAIVPLGVGYLFEGRGLDATARQVLADMEDAVTRADQFIKGLLDFSQERQFDLRPSALNAIIRESLHLVEHGIDQRGIGADLDLRAVPMLSLDADKLRQVFVNLLMNAVQAMGSNGTLSVRAAEAVLRDQAQLMRFSVGGFAADDAVALADVMDTGPGISKAQQSQRFEPFFTTEAFGDWTGLGLSMSRTIFELHQGAIDIGNREPRGASVVLVFPIKQPSGGAAMSRTKVLVVDDEVSITRMIKLTLERAGDFEVRTENLGANALHAARAFHPDVVFLDVMMPDLSGAEVAEKLEADPDLGDTPYVFLTAMVTKAEAASSGGEIGGRLFLAKPVKVQEMVAMINRVLGRA